MTDERLPPWLTYINLASSVDRRASIEAQFSEALPEVSLVRTDAIAELTSEPRSQGMSPREHACLMSHKRAIQSIPSGSMGLVLEDDALLSRHFSVGFRRLVKLLSSEDYRTRWDLVFLGHTPSFKSLGSMKFWLQEMRKFLFCS